MHRKLTDHLPSDNDDDDDEEKKKTLLSGFDLCVISELHELYLHVLGNTNVVGCVLSPEKCSTFEKNIPVTINAFERAMGHDRNLSRRKYKILDKVLSRLHKELEA